MTDPEKRIRVLLVGHGSSTTDALTMLFQVQSDLEVVGAVANESEILEHVTARRPHLILLDWDSSEKQIDRLFEELRSFDQPIVVVGLSIRAENRQVVMDAGAVGFAYKGDPPSRLLEIIRANGVKVTGY